MDDLRGHDVAELVRRGLALARFLLLRGVARGGNTLLPDGESVPPSICGVTAGHFYDSAGALFVTTQDYPVAVLVTAGRLLAHSAGSSVEDEPFGYLHEWNDLTPHEMILATFDDAICTASEGRRAPVFHTAYELSRQGAVAK